MTNLKPCPFCGSPAKESFDEGRNQEWWIVCSNDDCDIFPTSASRVQEDARAWWNKRAAQPEARQHDPVALHLKEREAFEAWWASRGEHKFSETPHMAAGAAWFARSDMNNG